MNKRSSLFLLLASTLILAGCTLPWQSGTPTPPKADLSSINATLEGTLNAASATGEYTLQTTQGAKLLHDGNATLEGFVGQSIVVTGQYSGTTLYVDQVTAQ